MKFKTTKKEILDNLNTISLGYQEANSLLSLTDPIAYTSGVYGWNADIYIMKNGWQSFAISTGYRPFHNVESSAIDGLVERYNQEAEELKSSYHADKISSDEFDNRASALVADFTSDVLCAISDYYHAKRA